MYTRVSARQVSPFPRIFSLPRFSIFGDRTRLTSGLIWARAGYSTVGDRGCQRSCSLLARVRLLSNSAASDGMMTFKQCAKEYPASTGIIFGATLFILFSVAPQIVLLHETRNHTKSNFIINYCDCSFV